jgi:hypothetical protein
MDNCNFIFKICIQDKKNNEEKASGSKKIRVFTSSTTKELHTPFCKALNQFIRDNDKNFIVQFADGDLAKCNNWLPSDLVDWLLDCHCHFILTHIHQGNFKIVYLNYFTNK